MITKQGNLVEFRSKVSELYIMAGTETITITIMRSYVTACEWCDAMRCVH